MSHLCCDGASCIAMIAPWPCTVHGEQVTIHLGDNNTVTQIQQRLDVYLGDCVPVSEVDRSKMPCMLTSNQGPDHFDPEGGNDPFRFSFVYVP